MCENLDGAKELAKSLTKVLIGKNVPKWVLVTFTVARPQTNDIRKNTKLVTETTSLNAFIASVNGISCSGGAPDGSTRAMQGMQVINFTPKRLISSYFLH